MYHTQKSITRYYTQRLQKCTKSIFHQEERETLDLHQKRPDFNHNGSFIYGLMVANVIAFAVAIYFMWVKNGLPVFCTPSQGTV